MGNTVSNEIDLNDLSLVQKFTCRKKTTNTTAYGNGHFWITRNGALNALLC
jgi:hypothetical protein